MVSQVSYGEFCGVSMCKAFLYTFRNIVRSLPPKPSLLWVQIHPRKLKSPLKTGRTPERIVFQPPFFRGKLLVVFLAMFATFPSGEKSRGRASSDSYKKCGETLIANVGRKSAKKYPKCLKQLNRN